MPVPDFVFLSADWLIELELAEAPSSASDTEALGDLKMPSLEEVRRPGSPSALRGG